MTKKIKLIENKTIWQGKTLKFKEHSLELSNGYKFKMELVEHPGAVVILPISSDGKFMLCKQYRYAVDRDLLEFPAGKLEPGENNPIECAKRELQEEIGMAARDWTDLGVIYPAPGFCDEKQYIFVAKDLYPSSLEADLDEDIEVVILDPKELEAAIVSGEMCDAKSLALYAKAKLLDLI